MLLNRIVSLHLLKDYIKIDPRKYKNSPAFYPLKNTNMTLNNTKSGYFCIFLLFLGEFLNFLGSFLYFLGGKTDRAFLNFLGGFLVFRENKVGAYLDFYLY